MRGVLNEGEMGWDGIELSGVCGGWLWAGARRRAWVRTQSIKASITQARLQGVKDCGVGGYACFLIFFGRRERGGLSPYACAVERETGEERVLGDLFHPCEDTQARHQRRTPSLYTHPPRTTHPRLLPSHPLSCLPPPSPPLEEQLFSGTLTHYFLYI